MNNTARDSSQPPRVWVLTGHKTGDNTQVLALAEALGWPFAVQRLVYRGHELLTNQLLGVTLAGIDKSRSSRLEAPWPDLLISAGRRNEPVARWVRRQSGGNTRLVHLGRPWAPPEVFDLIVVTPQYFVPQRANVLYINLPLHNLTRRHLDDVATGWAPRCTALPRPYWTVLLGGDSGPFVYTREKLRQLAAWLNREVADGGGSLLVSSSARTPIAVYDDFLGRLTVPVQAYHWGDNSTENPYQAFLALADHLVVGGESMSMLAEASVTGKPLHIFDLSDHPQAPLDALASQTVPGWHKLRYKPLVHRLAMLLGPRRMRRDITRVQRGLIASKRAVWAGQRWSESQRLALPSDLETAVARVRALIATAV